MSQLDFGAIALGRFEVLKKEKDKKPIILHALPNMESHIKN